MKNDLKIYIQSNPQQLTAAKVAKYSFKKQGFENIEIINLEDNSLLKGKFGKVQAIASNPLVKEW